MIIPADAVLLYNACNLNENPGQADLDIYKLDLTCLTWTKGDSVDLTQFQPW